jgi:hypothetical protein
MKKSIKNTNTVSNAELLKAEKPNLKVLRNQARAQKCKLALEKGYKFNESSGEIIGQKGKPIKSKTNGYTVISFMYEGIKKYLYGTTFVEYILKNENEMISDEELEFAKIYVKPSTEFLAKRKAKKKARTKVVSKESDYPDVPTNPVLAVNSLSKDLNVSYKKDELYTEASQIYNH